MCWQLEKPWFPPFSVEEKMLCYAAPVREPGGPMTVNTRLASFVLGVTKTYMEGFSVSLDFLLRTCFPHLQVG